MMDGRTELLVCLAVVAGKKEASPGVKLGESRLACRATAKKAIYG